MLLSKGPVAGKGRQIAKLTDFGLFGKLDAKSTLLRRSISMAGTEQVGHGSTNRE